MNSTPRIKGRFNDQKYRFQEEKLNHQVDMKYNFQQQKLGQHKATTKLQLRTQNHTQYQKFRFQDE
jgi:hypothetical protein